MLPTPLCILKEQSHQAREACHSPACRPSTSHPSLSCARIARLHCHLFAAAMVWLIYSIIFFYLIRWIRSLRVDPGNPPGRLVESFGPELLRQYFAGSLERGPAGDRPLDDFGPPARLAKEETPTEAEVTSPEPTCEPCLRRCGVCQGDPIHHCQTGPSGGSPASWRVEDEKLKHQRNLRALEALFQRKLRQAELTVQSVSKQLKNTTEQLQKAKEGGQATASGLARPVLAARAPKPLARVTFEKWQQTDLLKDFLLLDTSVGGLAFELNRHISQSSLLQYRIHELSDSCFLIKGAPKQLWTKQRLLLLRGAIWSILLGTIFSHEFAVFGDRARDLAREWAIPDVDHRSSTWRSLTAEMLLVRAGIIQCDAIGPSNPTASLRDLLVKRHSIQDSVSAMSGVLIKGASLRNSETGGPESIRRAKDLFKDCDQHARASLHHAQAGFIRSLEWLTKRFSARKQLSSEVEKVLINAQVLALQLAAQIHCFEFVIPTVDDMLGDVNRWAEEPLLSKANCCSNIPDGHIAFTVRPGLKKFADADLKQMAILHSAQVFILGESVEDSPRSRGPARSEQIVGSTPPRNTAIPQIRAEAGVATAYPLPGNHSSDAIQATDLKVSFEEA